jgi:DNA-binding transcriptional LysR family regulator
VIFTPSTHRFARRRSIRLAELQGERMVFREQGSTTRKAFDAALEKGQVKPEIVMEIASREVIREAVIQGIGIAAVSAVEYVPSPGLHMVQIRDAELYTYAHAVCLAERREMRMLRAFFDTILPEVKARSNK